MDIPEDVASMLDGVSLKTSARNMIQLSYLMSDGVVLASLIHKRYPKMVQIHNYQPTNTKDTKLDNWSLLNGKVLSKLRCPVSEADIQTIVGRGKTINDVVIRVMRELRLKMNAYEPQYLAASSVNTTDQLMKAAEMNSAYGKNRRDGGESVGTPSTVGRHMARQSSGISPPQRMQRARDGDVNRRPSRVAAGIAASLAGLGPGDEDTILLGSAGRRAEERRRTSAREKNAKIIRDSKKKQVRLSSVEMDEMFEKITSKLNDDLEEHSEKLDRLDSKSRQFDKHMHDLREANKLEMNGTDKRLSVALRSDALMPQSVTSAEPTFGMGRPEFLKAPSMEDGIHNHSFVGLVSPHSNQLQEMDGEGDMVFSSFVPRAESPPPPPPNEPPPAHILAKARGRGGEEGRGEPDEFGCLPEDYEDFDGALAEEGDEDEDNGEGGLVGGGGDGGGEVGESGISM
ncbi:hypothetical protein TrRE_jg6730, partial [Triparma retinervis]